MEINWHCAIDHGGFRSGLSSLFLNIIYFTRITHSSLVSKCFPVLKNCEVITAGVTNYSSYRMSGVFYMPGDRIQYMGPQFLRSNPKDPEVFTVELVQN